MSTHNAITLLFRQHGFAFRSSHPLTRHQSRVFNAISNCRTADMGSHTSKCSACGYTEISYNSCRNRHCPVCQKLDSIQWVDKLKHDLLPVPYFHIVFTLPEQLNALAMENKKLIYDLIFSASAGALKQMAGDRKHAGIIPAMISMLHTWGGNLLFHPHVHMLVPAGGPDIVTGKWKSCPHKFFIPVKALSQVFRGKFLSGLRHLYDEHLLRFSAVDRHLVRPAEFRRFISPLYQKKWVVFTQKSFRSSAQVLTYFGRYTHRVAISEKRIIRIDNDTVTFWWKDYRSGTQRTMTLDVVEFIRRFMLHVLPFRFHKLRYYGFLCHRYRNARLERIRRMLGVDSPAEPYRKLSVRDLLIRLTGRDIMICPRCRQPCMMPVDAIPGEPLG